MDALRAREPLVESSSGRYWLRPHVYVCAVDDGVVILDIKRNRYLGLSGAGARALVGVVEGWPHDPRWLFDEEADFKGGSENLSRALLSEDVLTDSLDQGKAARALSVQNVEMVPACSRFGTPRIRPHHVIDFAVACGRAWFQLKHSPLELIVRSAELQKSNCPSLDIPSASELSNRFSQMRRLIYSGSGRCLFHSLALFHFLTAYGQHPTWVIGVKTSPFSAHSWLQHRNLVFDDNPEKISEYTPILAI